VLLAVDQREMAGVPYPAVIELVRAAGRPLTLTLREEPFCPRPPGAVKRPQRFPQ
jgi:hypothetical protein